MTSTNPMTIRLELPREVFEDEKALESEDYRLDEPADLPVEPAAREARFVVSVTVIAAVSVAVLAERLLHFALTRRGQGVLVDTRETPPLVSVLAGVPQGFVVLVRPDGSAESIPAEAARSTLGDILGKSLGG